MALVKESVIFTSAPIKFTSLHDLNLQTLNRENNGYYQPVEAFQGTEGEWDKVPMFFGPTHPDLDYYDENPEMCLLESGCRALKGHLQNTRIETTGHPMLKSQANWNNEKDLEDYIQRGILSLSTAYRAEVEWNEEDWMAPPRIVGPVQPHHVLFFIEWKQNQPGDKGSGILNVTERFHALKTKINALLDNDLKQKFSELEKEFKSKETEFQNQLQSKDQIIADGEMAMKSKVDRITALEVEMSQVKDDLATANTTIESMVSEKDAILQEKKALEEDAQAKVTLIEASTEEKRILEEKIKEWELKDEDRKWEELKKTIPTGMVHTPELEAEVRNQWKEDPVALAAAITNHKADVQDKEKEGMQHAGLPESRRRGAATVQTYHWNNDTKSYDPDELVI